jgi:hypothetical protein
MSDYKFDVFISYPHEKDHTCQRPDHKKGGSLCRRAGH